MRDLGLLISLLGCLSKRRLLFASRQHSVTLESVNTTIVLHTETVRWCWWRPCVTSTTRHSICNTWTVVLTASDDGSCGAWDRSICCVCDSWNQTVLVCLDRILMKSVLGVSVLFFYNIKLSFGNNSRTVRCVCSRCACTLLPHFHENYFSSYYSTRWTALRR